MGWQVPAYCWTKSIGSGVLAVPAIAMALGRLSGNRVRDIALATVALFFTALTTVLLVWDLDHKERFLRVVFTPQVNRGWRGRVHSNRIQCVCACSVERGCGIFHSDFGLVVADSARRILRGSLYRVSLWTVRRARPVANAASAGAFDRASVALWIGCAGVASGDDRWFDAGPVVRHSYTDHQLGCTCLCCLARLRCLTLLTTHVTALD